jgi:hypothetical protein
LFLVGCFTSDAAVCEAAVPGGSASADFASSFDGFFFGGIFCAWAKLPSLFGLCFYLSDHSYFTYYKSLCFLSKEGMECTFPNSP